MNTDVLRRRDVLALRGRRGNTLVLVTAILVLLVIIATAYISRTQGGRVVAAAQRKAIDRDDRALGAVGVVADTVADSLFPRLVNQSDPAVAVGLAATSSTARLKVPFWNGQRLDRYMVDPQTYDSDGDGVPDSLVAPYNVAPYETRPWTNWPDSAGQGVPFGAGALAGVLFDVNNRALGDDNPIGNPGYGDSRWLRSTEPERAYDGAGRLRGDAFSHWPHLSWPATAENGWRVCYDISNVASLGEGGFTITSTAASIFAAGAANDYMLIQEPVALQTPYEQWLPGVAPVPFLDADNFIARRNQWFGRPFDHFSSLYGPGAMPNFIRLNDLGPKRHTFQSGTNRNVVERTLADADGDGFTDSFWFLLPGTSEDGIRQVAAVSVVDNASMVDVNVATRFDRWGTAGHTPADIALTSRLVQTNRQMTPFGSNDPVYDEFDTWTGLFSDPQNATPANAVWGLGYSADADYQVQPDTFDGPETLRTGYDPRRFGDSLSTDPSWLVQSGVVNQERTAFEAPYQTPLATYKDGLDPARAAFDRRRYFQRRQNDGGLFVARDITGSLLGIGTSPTRGFTDADELELRMFAASNYGPVVSSLERTVNEPWNYQANFLRSSLARSESVENFLDYFDGNPNTPWPPQQGIAIGDQLSALELLRDNRHRITTYSATRNDLRPLHLRQTVGYDSSWDYVFGRLFSTADLSNPGVLDFSWKAYQRSLQKLDLRSPLYVPLDEYEADLYGSTDTGAPNGDPLFVGPIGVLANAEVDSSEIYEGLYPGSLDPDDTQHFLQLISLDRAWRFRREFQSLATRSMVASATDPSGFLQYQSYLGSNFQTLDASQNVDQLNFYKTQLLAASWSANVDTYRDGFDGQSQVPAYNMTVNPLGATETVFVDPPIYPTIAPRVPAVTQGEQGFPQDLTNLIFPGMEKQPFLMEAFFCKVYPPSNGNGGSIYDELLNESAYRIALQTDRGVFGDDQIDYLQPYKDAKTIPPLFRGEGERWVDQSSEPAIVFAIQIANPFDEPIPLHDIYIRIGNSRPNQYLNLGRLPSPHPMAISQDPDPANPQDSSRTRLRPYYFPSELYLGPTLPDAPRTAIVFGVIPPGNSPSGFEDDFGVSFAQFHQRWMDFMDIEPGALFGWGPTLPLSQHQTLVFDASPRTYHRASPATDGVEFAPTLPPLRGFDPDDWFGAPGGSGSSVDQSVELLRFVPSPPSLNANPATCLVVVDRLDDYSPAGKIFQQGGTHGGGSDPNAPRPEPFVDTLQKLSDTRFMPPPGPEFVAPAGGSGADVNAFAWAGIPLANDKEFVATWVRAGRAWGWDVNRNGVYDMSEISPRYVFSEIPEDVIASEISGGDYPPIAVMNGSGQPTSMFASFIEWSDDPDLPWFYRPTYLTPLAIKPMGTGTGGYEWDFDRVRSKPTHLTTASALKPGQSGTYEIDYDAGFPLLADGTVRMTADLVGWPGKPASTTGLTWVLMDKGQAPNENAAQAARLGIPVGADANGNGVDDGLEQYPRVWLEKDRWAYPLQMLQKDADFEQVGEIGNVFLWGHAIGNNPQPNQGLVHYPTFLTFSEIMNNDRPDAPLPVVRWSLRRNGTDEVGIPNASRALTNRYHIDPGTPNAPANVPVVGFQPFTSSLELKRVAEPWTPALPAGLSIFDGLVCEGPGSYFPDVDGDGVLAPIELLAIDDARFGNASGFSGRGTRGLINLNTASVEVLRTLPHMSRLVYNDRPNWPNVDLDAGPWRGFVPSAPRVGDVDDRARPRNLGTRNVQYTRVPEAIERYRRGAGLFNGGGSVAQRVESVQLPYGENTWIPYYDDRGTLNQSVAVDRPPLASWLDTFGFGYLELPGTPGLFPGMRRGAGIVGLGELLVMDRLGVPLTNEQSWPQRSVSISGAARNPYAFQNDLGIAPTVGSSGVYWDLTQNTPENRARLGLGWRPAVSLSSGIAEGPSNQTDARLSTDRQNVSWRQGFDSDGNEVRVEVPDHVAGDAEEANLLFAGISNLVSVRSDVFTVHMKVRSFRQNPVTGVWDATNPEFVVDDSRYVFVVDRSRCDVAGDAPEIRLLSRVPE